MAPKRTFRRRRFPAWQVAAAAVALSLVVWSAFFMSVDRWGALGEWIGGAGTVAAVWTALHISNRDARAAEAQRQTDAREREARELAAAESREHRKANLVLSEPAICDAADYAHLSPDEAPDLIVRIINHSPEPIVLPRLEHFNHPARGTTHWSIFTDPAGKNEGWSPADILGPGGVEVVEVRVTYQPALTQDQVRDMRDAIPVIAWNDAGGRRWRRQGNDTPQRVYPGDSGPIGGDEWYRVTQR
jgi:hypothetical protein